MLILYLVVNIIVLCFSDKCMYYNFGQITYHKQKNNVNNFLCGSIRPTLVLMSVHGEGILTIYYFYDLLQFTMTSGFLLPFNSANFGCCKSSKGLKLVFVMLQYRNGYHRCVQDVKIRYNTKFDVNPRSGRFPNNSGTKRYWTGPCSGRENSPTGSGWSLSVTRSWAVGRPQASLGYCQTRGATSINHGLERLATRTPLRALQTLLCRSATPAGAGFSDGNSYGGGPARRRLPRSMGMIEGISTTVVRWLETEATDGVHWKTPSNSRYQRDFVHVFWQTSGLAAA